MGAGFRTESLLNGTYVHGSDLDLLFILNAKNGQAIRAVFQKGAPSLFYWTIFSIEEEKITEAAVVHLTNLLKGAIDNLNVSNRPGLQDFDLIGEGEVGELLSFLSSSLLLLSFFLFFFYSFRL